MSKILEQGTEFNDLECLRGACELMEIPFITDPAGNLVTMHGYSGATFEAHLGIQKQAFTAKTGMHTYGDLGFRQQEDGSMKFIADDILVGSSQFGEKFMDGFTSAYAEKKYEKEMYEQGFALASRNVTEEGVDLQFMEIGF